MQSTWVEVLAIDDIPPLGARVVTTSRGDIAVFRTRDDAIFALDDSCPHKQGRLSQGIVHGHSVTCPLHNWIINLASGEAQAPDSGCANRVPVRVLNGKVLLEV